MLNLKLPNLTKLDKDSLLNWCARVGIGCSVSRDTSEDIVFVLSRLQPNGEVSYRKICIDKVYTSIEQANYSLFTYVEELLIQPFLEELKSRELSDIKYKVMEIEHDFSDLYKVIPISYYLKAMSLIEKLTGVKW